MLYLLPGLWEAGFGAAAKPVQKKIQKLAGARLRSRSSSGQALRGRFIKMVMVVGK